MRMQYFQYKGIDIRFNLYGSHENPALLLFHGYLESLEIWEEFIPLLLDDYYVIAMDLPGHGKSGVFSSVHRMDDLAESAYFLISSLGIKKVHLAGHSMGGYVALAFREDFYYSSMSCVLFHSTCYSDTPEKKENRKREIELVKNGKKDIIINTNIPRAFADDNLEKFRSKVERAKKIAGDSDNQGIIALLNGMKERPDRSILLKDDNIPVLVIAGKKDNYIPFEVAEGLIEHGTNIELAVLENSGHMGFIEEREKAAMILKAFLNKHNNQ